MIKVASYNIRKGVGTDRIRSPDRILARAPRNRRRRDRVAGGRSPLRPARGDPQPAHLADHSPWKAVPFGDARAVERMARQRAAGAQGRDDRRLRGDPPADAGAARRGDGGPAHQRRGGADRRHAPRSVGADAAAPGRLRSWRISTPARSALPDGDDGRPQRMDRGSRGASRISRKRFTIAATGPSFHARRPVGRLDRIMASPELRIADCGVHHSPASRTASDHLPIWAQDRAGMRREKELRMALVCYGGISLAVYMHGITKEIWRLARASRAFHADETPALPSTERVYHAVARRDRGGSRICGCACCPTSSPAPARAGSTACSWRRRSPPGRAWSR